MTTLLIAAALIAQDPTAASWAPKAPYKENDDAKYTVKMAIDENGEQLDVEMTAHIKITKKTDKGFEGSFGWTQLSAAGNDMPDESFVTQLKPNGVLKSVDSTYGPGMRRMLLPFFFAYPDKPVAVGETWTYKDTADDKTDGHTANFEYKLVGNEDLKAKKTYKVTVKFNEEGPEPLKGDGTYWIGEDGRVLKYELNVTGWTVPVAGQIFAAKITGELAS